MENLTIRKIIPDDTDFSRIHASHQLSEKVLRGKLKLQDFRDIKETYWDLKQSLETDMQLNMSVFGDPVDNVKMVFDFTKQYPELAEFTKGLHIILEQIQKMSKRDDLSASYIVTLQYTLERKLKEEHERETPKTNTQINKATDGGNDEIQRKEIANPYADQPKS